MVSYSNPRGPAPKPESKRRRYAKPESYGAAEPTTAPAAKSAARELDIDGAHPFIAALWDTVQASCEARFYSDADGSGCASSCGSPTGAWLAGSRPRTPGRPSSPA